MNGSDGMSEIILAIWFFVFGACMGSFYNVLIDRLPEGEDIIKSRSKCVSCGTILKWYDMIPCLSFVMLKGRCRYCKTKLSWKYLISELSVAALFVLSFMLYGTSEGFLMVALHIILWSMLFVTGVMDYRSGIVIDQIVLVFSLAGVVLALISGRSFVNILISSAVGFLFYGLIYIAARFVFKKEGFGQGDVILLTGIGAFFEYKTTILIGFIAFYVALVFIVIFALQKKANKQMEIPFAPAMCLSAFLVSIFEVQILDFFARLLGFSA